MASLIETFRNWFKSTTHLPAGMYTYLSPQDDPRNYRLSLRLEQDGHGLLVINGSTILHLNPTAAEYAYYLVHNRSSDYVARAMTARYTVKPEQAREDYASLSERIQTLINQPDLDPETFLDFDRRTPLSGYISAPYRLDCALTYRLPESESTESAPVERVKRELTTGEWFTILDKAWQAGIPQIVFTGGEATLRDDLPDLVERASQNGQVTGLLTNGLRLAEQDYLNKLLNTGLDHLMIVFNPNITLAWQALDNVISADLFVTVHLTVSTDDQEPIVELLEKLSGRGVKAISLTAKESGLAPVLQKARTWIADHQVELVWNLPVPYSDRHPISFETASEANIEGAGRAWLYVEPDGDVLPTQGMNQVLGNFLSDPWQAIWKPEIVKN